MLYNNHIALNMYPKKFSILINLLLQKHLASVIWQESCVNNTCTQPFLATTRYLTCIQWYWAKKRMDKCWTNKQSMRIQGDWKQCTKGAHLNEQEDLRAEHYMCSWNASTEMLRNLYYDLTIIHINVSNTFPSQHHFWWPCSLFVTQKTC